MQKHLKTKQVENGRGPFSGCRDDWQTAGPSGPFTRKRAEDMRRPPFTAAAAAAAAADFERESAVYRGHGLKYDPNS